MTITLREGDDYIKLGQALKKAGVVENGAHAKEEISEGNILVNGAKEYRRGRKLKDGDVITCASGSYRIVKEGKL